jgi:hypothetical protein
VGDRRLDPRRSGIAVRQTTGIYPFGSKLKALAQVDRSPKTVFVLGVYASAVHARWIGPDGRVFVRALAVASEPTIFWNGAGADAVLGAIPVPAAAGHLEPADPKFNGPSGRSLDDDFVTPLGLNRMSTWLCDLVPHTCLNAGQLAAIQREYEPRRATWGLPPVELPNVPRSFADDQRRVEVLAEIREASAEVIILLGDLPIRQFSAHYDTRRRRLADFGDDDDGYGRLHPVMLGDHACQILPLAHPRQVSGLGIHSSKWRYRHERWKRKVAPALLD